MTQTTGVPPTKASDEAAPHQHRMAQAQGDAYVTALHHMANTVADAGGDEHVGDVIVAYAIEGAEGMYEMVDGSLVWREPDEYNAHIEISVRDAADHRFIPGLEVTVKVTDESTGAVAFEGRLPMLWHPWLYHYGANVTVPEAASYQIDVHVDPPTFHRHDKKNGRRYAEAVDVSFSGVKIDPGSG